jgi:hypothetical protein
MAPWPLIAAAAAGLVLPPAQALPAEAARNPGETAQAFAHRAFDLPPDSDEHVTSATWNGRAAVFVDFVRGAGDDQERPLMALLQTPGGAWRRIGVTVGEEEGGVPDIAAIGFANADRDPAQELIVILAWPQQHAAVSGTLYEVRLFDDPKPGDRTLKALKTLESHFTAHACDCTWDDGRTEHFRFKTVAAVKAELKALGF